MIVSRFPRAMIVRWLFRSFSSQCGLNSRDLGSRNPLKLFVSFVSPGRPLLITSSEILGERSMTPIQGWDGGRRPISHSSPVLPFAFSTCSPSSGRQSGRESRPVWPSKRLIGHRSAFIDDRSFEGGQSCFQPSPSDLTFPFPPLRSCSSNIISLISGFEHRHFSVIPGFLLLRPFVLIYRCVLRSSLFGSCLLLSAYAIAMMASPLWLLSPRADYQCSGSGDLAVTCRRGV
jgi:hypothetical protein